VKFKTILLATAFAVLGGAAASSVSAAEAATCATVDGPRCIQKLSTGIDMAYVEVGPSDGPAVILLHGLTDSARSWSQAMAALHDLDPTLRIIALDQRGHGQTSMPSDPACPKDPKTCFTPKLFSDDLAAFLDARGIAKATVAGHSMGSFIAQEFALDHPEKTERDRRRALTSRHPRLSRGGGSAFPIPPNLVSLAKPQESRRVRFASWSFG
jgi:pimeloyl-ACP methyl ester carboxylesterase